MDIIISDFDNTLFKRNFGLIEETIDYLVERNLPVYIVTYRADDQQTFILDTLADSGLNVVGLATAGSRYKDPATKLQLVDFIMTRHNIVEALDDDEQVVLGLRQRGIKARQVYTGVAQ